MIRVLRRYSGIYFTFFMRNSRISNMVIDFHTHIFNDQLAPKARAALINNSHGAYRHCTDMTRAGLLAYMDAHGIDKSVVLSIATKPTQVGKINAWAEEINDDRLIAFGAVYPLGEDWKRDIDDVVARGLKGIKLHPEYQRFYVDDESVLPLYDYAFSKGLIVLWHAGYDPVGTPPYRSSPRRFAALADRYDGAKMVVAHLGGQEQWVETAEFLAGKNVWMDTSMATKYCPKDLFEFIVKKHGADRILFASDSPWSDTAEAADMIRGCDFTDGDKEKILHGTAEKLLGLAE